jgi:UDPglucose--hexose-1-phosphate uridylyltransferase
MDAAGITEVVRTWKAQVSELSAHEHIRYVQIFENKGAIMGCSNPHPHCQIWASEQVPEKPLRRARSQQQYMSTHGTDMLGDYLEHELRIGQRVVCENEHFGALVPFWAVWPYEVSVIAKRHLQSFIDLNSEEEAALADLMRRVCVRYDNLFEASFPYSMGFYSAPTDGAPHPYWRFHAEYYPPLLRSASIKKFLVGYEMTADPQRDLTAEQATSKLRELSEVRFS